MSKNREIIYLDELITKIRENREIGKIMGNVMIEIAKSCKTVQKEEMPNYKQIKRDEVMSKLAEDKQIYGVILHNIVLGQGVYNLSLNTIAVILKMIKMEDVVFYEKIEEGEK